MVNISSFKYYYKVAKSATNTTASDKGKYYHAYLEQCKSILDDMQKELAKYDKQCKSIRNDPRINKTLR